MFNGVRIIESAYLEEDGEPYPVRRSWCDAIIQSTVAAVGVHASRDSEDSVSWRRQDRP